MNSEESEPQLSRIERIEQNGLTSEDVQDFLELGIRNLPPLEGGTMKDQGGERQNLKTRIKYLEENLGIKAAEIPNPLVEDKNLSPRLVSDVLVDLITLCHSVDTLPEKSDPLPLVEVFNSSLAFRKAKGRLIEEKLPNGKSYRQHGLNHNFSPGRSDNPLRPGYLKTIFKTLEESLKTSPAKPQQT